MDKTQCTEVVGISEFDCIVYKILYLSRALCDTLLCRSAHSSSWPGRGLVALPQPEEEAEVHADKGRQGDGERGHEEDDLIGALVVILYVEGTNVPNLEVQTNECTLRNSKD